MTTTITVKTHDWPVRVVTEDKTGENFHATGENEVPPHSEQSFHITSTRAIRFEELPKPAESAEEAAETEKDSDEDRPNVG